MDFLEVDFLVEEEVVFLVLVLEEVVLVDFFEEEEEDLVDLDCLVEVDFLAGVVFFFVGAAALGLDFLAEEAEEEVEEEGDLVFGVEDDGFCADAFQCTDASVL